MESLLCRLDISLPSFYKAIVDKVTREYQTRLTSSADFFARSRRIRHHPISSFMPAYTKFISLITS